MTSSNGVAKMKFPQISELNSLKFQLFIPSNFNFAKEKGAVSKSPGHNLGFSAASSSLLHLDFQMEPQDADFLVFFDIGREIPRHFPVGIEAKDLVFVDDRGEALPQFRDICAFAFALSPIVVIHRRFVAEILDVVIVVSVLPIMLIEELIPFQVIV